MVLVYVLGDSHPIVLGALPHPVATGATRAEYWRRLPEAEVSVLSVGAAVAEGLTLIEEVRRKRPAHPIVIVVPFEHRAAHSLVMGLPMPRDLIWIVCAQGPPRELASAVAKALAVDPVHGYYAAIVTDHPLSAIVESALRAIMVAPDPVRSVRERCATLHVPESTFRYHWARDPGGCSIKELIDWRWLLRYVHRSSGAATASPRLPPRKTMERMSRRLVGKPLDSAAHGRVVEIKLEEWLVEELAEVEAQLDLRTIELEDVLECESCSINLELVATLAPPVEETGFTQLPPVSLARDHQGRFYAGPMVGDAIIAVFEADGTYLRGYGQSGQGPREFTGSPASMLIRLPVMDSGSLRVLTCTVCSGEPLIHGIS